MSDDEAKQEPSMQEILASIRQIISDDADGERAARAVPGTGNGVSARDADVLELTEMMNDDGTVTDLTRARHPEPAVPAARDPSTTPDAEKEEVLAVGADAASDDDARLASPAKGIVSDAAAGDVARALGGLASATGAPRHVRLGESGKTLEALVKEMLRPMLKAWLDENLPPLVERLVEREIHRISGGAGET